MKNLFKVLALLLIFSSCSKEEDDTNNICTADCSVLKGNFVSLNNQPVPNVKISMKYRIPGFGGNSIRKILATKTDQSGNYLKTFFIKDHELGNLANGYFLVDVDDSNLDVNKYIRTNNLIGNTTSDIGFAIYAISTRDTIIEQDYYIPKKAFIRINLNNFLPLQEDDFFEVQTLYPFGPKIGTNDFLDSQYGTGFSGYGNWRSTTTNTVYNVFVAEGEKNMIRIYRRKNGVNTSEDFPIFVPSNNAITLSYDY